MMMMMNKALTFDAAKKRIYRNVSDKLVYIFEQRIASDSESEDVHDILARTIPKPNSTRWNSVFDSIV